MYGSELMTALANMGIGLKAMPFKADGCSMQAPLHIAGLEQWVCCLYSDVPVCGRHAGCLYTRVFWLHVNSRVCVVYR